MDKKDSKDIIFAPEAILLASPYKNKSTQNTPNLNSITRLCYHFNPNEKTLNSP